MNVKILAGTKWDNKKKCSTAHKTLWVFYVMKKMFVDYCIPLTESETDGELGSHISSLWWDKLVYSVALNKVYKKYISLPSGYLSCLKLNWAN